MELFSYFCFSVFVIAAGLRVYRQFKLPLHLRWEIYPVKHEPGAKAEYGGSYMEETDWWTKERSRSLLNEIKFMVPEILFLRGLWQENRKLWWVSFPFHFGLYLLLGCLALLLLGALAAVGGIQGGGWLSLLEAAALVTGGAGLILGWIGSLGLLYRRLADEELRIYSAPADYLNLGLFLLFCAVGFLSWIIQDPSLSGARAYLVALLTFGGRPAGAALQRTALGGLTIILASFLIAYVPLTHMAHMFMKYFIYHSVRWEDAPSVKGGAIEAAVLENLGLRPTWAAAHVGADGKKSWAEIATSQPQEGK